MVDNVENAPEKKKFFRSAVLFLVNNFWVLALIALIPLLYGNFQENRIKENLERAEMLRCIRGSMNACAACAGYSSMAGAACREILFAKAEETQKLRAPSAAGKTPASR